MFIKELITDEWVGARNVEAKIDNPTWSQIESAISALDGKQRSLVTLRADEDIHMSIGAGSERFIAYVTFDNLDFYSLTDPSAGDGVVYLVAGGQMGDYPATQCVHLPEVLQAARTFAEEGELDSRVTWQKQ